MMDNKANNQPNKIELATSTNVLLRDRDKQHRIHTWLGEQAADFFPSLHSEPLTDSFNHEESSDFKLKHSSSDKGNQHKNFHETGKDASKGKSPKSCLKISSNENPHHKILNQLSDRVQKSSHHSHKYYPQRSLSPKRTFPSDMRHVSAATKIQASWRGFHARSKNARVVEIRHELRARRMEHYINTLCHELCVLKEKQKADRKLRELQTEAIRFMWSQIRQLQTKFDTKFQEFETSLSASTSSKDKIQESVIEKESISWSGIKENNELKQTVEKLQSQVLQLQEALLSFSDKLVCDNEDVIATRNVSEDEMETDQEKDCSTEGENPESEEVVASTSLSLKLPPVDDGEVLSARDNMPKLSLQNILVDLNSCLTEKELWSVCEQATQAIKAMKKITLKYVSPTSVYVRQDGLISFSDAEEFVDETYLAPEISAEVGSPSQKALIFSLAVTMWSAADFNMKDDQAPCLSQSFENLLVKMSNDDVKERVGVDEVLCICAEHHSSTQSNSLQACSSLHAETCDIKRGKRRQMKDVNFIEFFAKDIEKTRHDFRSGVCPQITQLSFQLKPAHQRQLLPKPDVTKTPHEEIMDSIVHGFKLQQSAKPKVYTVQDLFHDNPELVEKLNILPNQQRKNIKAAHLALRKSSLNGNIRPGIPTAPHTLKAEIRRGSSYNQPSFDGKTCTLILRWHPSFIFDRHGNKTKSTDILGYRIYVNGHAKGMVSGAKCRALLDGLKRSNDYRIHVCAVASLGESDLSNTVIANLNDDSITSSPPSPDNNHSPVSSPHVKFSSRSNFFESMNSSEILPTPDKELSKTSDVVDRVLRRYGIKKSTSSSNSPSPVIPPHKSKFSFKKDHNEDAAVGDAFSTSQESIPPTTAYAASSTSSDDHITPRTKALLDQLKDELLNK